MQVRCPECRHSIELAQETALNEITCPQCGSSFSLISEKTVTYELGGITTLGHFELIEQIGAGHFGSVWKARDTELDRMVAVKIPRKGKLDDAETEHFFREARAAAQLKHPNIVSVHEVGREGDTVYIVSEFVQGVTLGDYLSAGVPGREESIRLCAKIASALHHAHEAGVVHRDLKPANVILADPDHTPFIMDFGLAKRETGEITMTVEGHILGTPAYMSPEQAKGEGHRADRRSDIYSLGVILFRLLTGELPFRGNVRMLVSQIINDEPPSPRKLIGSLSRDLETICLKCLEKDPARRYQTAQEVSEELERFLAGQPIKARPISTSERFWRWAKRNRTTASLSAAAVLLLLGISMVTTVSYFRETELRQAVEESLVSETAARKEADLQSHEARQQRAEAFRQRDAARRSLYFSHMLLAQQAWESGDIKHLTELLDRHISPDGEEDLRGWEWYYFRSLIGNNLHTFKAHSDNVESLAWSANGRFLASASQDGTARVWDGTHWTALHLLHGHTRRVSAVRWHSESKWLATGGDDRTVRIWDAESGAEVHKLEGHMAQVTSVAWRPEQDQVASAAREGEIRMWSAETGTLVSSFRTEPDVFDICWSPDGRLLAVGTDKRTELWDPDTQEVEQTVPVESPVALAWSTDGKQIAATDGSGQVRVWDIAAQKFVLDVDGHNPRGESVAWEPNGRRLASVGLDQPVRLWDVEAGKISSLLRGHVETPIQAVAWSPDGSRLATGGNKGIIHIWDATRDQAHRLIRNDDTKASIATVAWSPDGRHIANAGWWLGSNAVPITVWEWNRESARVVMQAKSKPTLGVCWSPDSKRIAGGTGDTVTVWNAATGEELQTLRGHTRPVHAVEFSPDGKRLASAGGDFFVRIWDLIRGEEQLALRVENEQVSCARWSPTGDRIAAPFGDDRIVIWDANTGVRLKEFETDRGTVMWLSWHPTEPRIAMAGATGLIRVMNVNSGDVLLTLRGHAPLANCVEWSPDGRRLVTSSFDHTVRIWDAATGQQIVSLKAPLRFARTVHWSPDGKTIVAGTAFHATVWDASVGSKDDRDGLTDAVEPFDKRARQDPENIKYLVELAEALETETDALLHSDAPPQQAEVVAQKAVALNQQLVARKPDDSSRRRELAYAHGRLAITFLRQDRYQEAAGEFSRLVEMFEALVLVEPAQSDLRSELAVNYRNLGITLNRGGRDQEAEVAFRQAISLVDKLLVHSPAHQKLRANKAASLSNLASLLRHMPDRQAEAIQLCQSALELRRELAAETPNDSQFKAELAYSCNNLARLLADTTDTNLRNPIRAIAVVEEAVQKEPDEFEYWQTLAIANYRAGDWDSCFSAIQESLARKNGYNPFNMYLMAMTHWQRGARDKAREWYDRAKTLAELSKGKPIEFERIAIETATLLGITAELNSRS